MVYLIIKILKVKSGRKALRQTATTQYVVRITNTGIVTNKKQYGVYD